METLEKVKPIPQICGVELDFNGELIPENSKLTQNFFNSKSSNNNWNDTYFGKKTVSFRETSKKTKPGLSYQQTFKIKFPSNDESRSDRLELFTKVKFIKINFDNDTSAVLGRNDFFQNKLPEVKIESTEKITTVTFTTKSIFSIGFVDALDANSEWFNDLLPHDIPITFINI